MAWITGGDIMGQRAETFAGRSIGDWAFVKPRIMVRLIERRRAGPLARPYQRGLDFDLAVDLPGMIVRPTAMHVERWSRPDDLVWAAAKANSRRLVRPAVAEGSGPGLHLSVLTGDQWTSGMVFDIDYFLRRHLPAANRRGNRAPGWLWVPNPTTVVVARPQGRQPPGDDTVTALALQGFTGHRRFPFNLARLR